MFNGLTVCVVTPEYHCLLTTVQRTAPAIMLETFSAAFNCAFSAVAKEQREEVSVINLKRS
jgi:hypothetical protein